MLLIISLSYHFSLPLQLIYTVQYTVDFQVIGWKVLEMVRVLHSLFFVPLYLELCVRTKCLPLVKLNICRHCDLAVSPYMYYVVYDPVPRGLSSCPFCLDATALFKWQNIFFFLFVVYNLFSELCLRKVDRHFQTKVTS